MSPRPRRWLGAIVLVVSLATCQSPSGDEDSVDLGNGDEYDAPEDLIGALGDEGVRCTGLEVVPRKESDLAVCSMSGEVVSAATYDDHEALRHELESTSDPNEARVVGPNWVVTLESRSTAETIQDAIGGSIR